MGEGTFIWASRPSHTICNPTSKGNPSYSAATVTLVISPPILSTHCLHFHRFLSVITNSAQFYPLSYSNAEPLRIMYLALAAKANSVCLSASTIGLRFPNKMFIAPETCPHRPQLIPAPISLGSLSLKYLNRFIFERPRL